jgi:hypothetical protein
MLFVHVRRSQGNSCLVDQAPLLDLPSTLRCKVRNIFAIKDLIVLTRDTGYCSILVEVRETNRKSGKSQEAIRLSTGFPNLATNNDIKGESRNVQR